MSGKHATQSVIRRSMPGLAPKGSLSLRTERKVAKRINAIASRTTAITTIVRYSGGR